MANVRVNGNINNQSPGKLHRLNNHNWSGNGNYPEIIDNDGEFTHLGEQPGGSVAAVVYSGINKEGLSSDNCAWLVAWDVPLSTPSNKVYVECGDIHHYQPPKIDWDVILENLHNSPNQSDYIDQATGTKASAQIDDGKHPAHLQATFGLA